MSYKRISHQMISMILIGLFAICAHADQDLLKPENYQCIKTERLILRPFARSDFSWYQKFVSHPKIAQNLYSDGLPNDLKAEAENNTKQLTLGGHSLPTTFTVCLKSYYRFSWMDWFLGPKRIGIVGLDYAKGSKPDCWQLYVYYALDAKFHQQGYGTEASRVITSYAAQTVKAFPGVFEGLYAWVFTTNIASIKTLAKIGFKTITQAKWMPNNQGRAKQFMVFSV